jgi:CheY-like chemotaxis protein
VSTTPGGPQRALVIDDTVAVRDLVSAVLSADGYEVDVAATLKEAQDLGAENYHAVLVDVQLGNERGTELVAALRKREPDAVTRCLFLSGGALDELPADVAVLPKPFRVDDLLAAVHRLGAARPEPAVAVVDELSWPLPTGTRWTGARHVLKLASALRERERQHLADFLHAGPIQDLTAVLLGLGILRRSVNDETAGRIDELEARLGGTMAALREELGAWRAHLGSRESLSAALKQRLEGLLTESLSVDTELRGSPPDHQETASVTGFVELVLLELDPDRAVARAHVTVRSEVDHLQVGLVAVPAGGAADPGQEAERAERLELLAEMLGAIVEPGAKGDGWRVMLRLPRDQHPAS